MSFFYESKDRLECSVFSALTYGDHFHDHLEMFLLETGRTNARVNGVEYPMQAGDIFSGVPQSDPFLSGIGGLQRRYMYLPLSPL